MLNEMIEDVLQMKEKLERLEKLNKQLAIEKADVLMQLKTKFSNEEYVLVHVGDLTRIMSQVEDAEGDASNLESDICDLEYSEVGTISSHINDCSYTAQQVVDTCKGIFTMVEELLEVEEEAEEEPAKKEPAKKKTPKNDVSIDEIFKTNN